MAVDPDEVLTLNENANVTARKTRRGRDDQLHLQRSGLDGDEGDAAGRGTVNTTWTYRLNGKIDTLTDDNGSGGNSLDYNYDSADRMFQTKTHIQSVSGTKTVTYTLDANGNRTKLAWPTSDAGGAYFVGYCYDNLNRMTAAMENSTSSGCATNLLATYSV